MPLTTAELARCIDHTELRPEASAHDIARLCAEAVQHGFGAVCVAPAWVGAAARQLAGTSVAIATVIGFPHGSTLSSVKAYEAARALDAGATELDMVLALGALKSHDTVGVVADVRGVVDAAHGRGRVKVILETALLSDAEKVLACRLCEHAGADYVKTSTGFAASGANAQDVALLRSAVSPRIGVKASGGIRTLAQARIMLAAGATRLGTSKSVAILRELAAR